MKTIARIISLLFFPFFIPIYSILMFFSFDFFQFYSIEFIRQVFSCVVIFASLLPMTLIFLLYKLKVIENVSLKKTTDRLLPYSCTILSFLICTVMLYRLYMPKFVYSTIFASSIAILLCIIVNFKWKISSHAISMGCWFGGVLFASLHLSIFPSSWIYLILLSSGLLASARLYLRKNTESQLLSGFVIGTACTFLLPNLSFL